jgi:hypothetical protein
VSVGEWWKDPLANQPLGEDDLSDDLYESHSSITWATSLRQFPAQEFS